MQSMTLAHLVLGTNAEETVDAAAAAGFAAVGIRICARRPGDPYAGRPIVGDAAAANALRMRAADRGIRLSNVSAYQFYPDVTWEQVAPVIETTHALGVPTIVANGFDPDLARFSALFGRYCEQAAAAGIRVALEFLPYSGVRDLDAAMRVISDSGADNAGVLLDALHLERSGGTPRDIARLPANRIVFAQLCDAVRMSEPLSDDALLKEARTARLPAGAGELPLFDFLDALPAALEIEYEVARADLADRSPLEKAHAAAEDASRFMARYQAHRAGSRAVAAARA